MTTLKWKMTNGNCALARRQALVTPRFRALLNLHEISSVHVLRYPCDYSGGGARLHIEDDHLANDLAGQRRSMVLDFGGGNWAAFENTGGCFSGSFYIYGGSTAAKLVGLKAT